MSIFLNKRSVGGGGGGGGSPSTVDEGPFLCAASVVLGDAVYTDPGASELRKAKADGLATMPCVGFVISKPDATHAVIRTDGNLTGLLDDVGGVLLPGVGYFVSSTAAGKITSTPLDSPPLPSGYVSQAIGEVAPNGSLMINLDSDLVVL